MAWLRKVLVFLWILSLSTCTSLAHSSNTPGEYSPRILPLSVHYLTDEKDIRERFERSLTKSNELLMPHGIGLAVWSEDRAYRLPSRITTLQDRQRLGARAIKDGTFHVFVSDDLALEGDAVNGLHSNFDAYNFVVIKKTAPLTTLAHEIGHALSLGHEETEENVMSSDRHDSKSYFTRNQGKIMRRHFKGFTTRTLRAKG